MTCFLVKIKHYLIHPILHCVGDCKFITWGTLQSSVMPCLGIPASMKIVCHQVDKV